MQRRLLLAAATLATVLVSAGAGAWAATGIQQQITVEYRQIQLKVDGAPVAVDAEPFIHLEKGRVFIPARPLAEALGAKVAWDDTNSSVEVYTKRYITSTVVGEKRVWSMPGAGFTITAPLGWIRQEGNDSALLHLALPEAMGLNGLVGITQLPEDDASLTAQFDQTLEGLRTVYSDLVPADRIETESEVNATAAAKLAGKSVGMVVRLIKANGGHWLLFGLYPEERADTSKPEIQEILQSFRAN